MSCGAPCRSSIRGAWQRSVVQGVYCHGCHQHTPIIPFTSCASCWRADAVNTLRDINSTQTPAVSCLPLHTARRSSLPAPRSPGQTCQQVVECGGGRPAALRRHASMRGYGAASGAQVSGAGSTRMLPGFRQLTMMSRSVSRSCQDAPYTTSMHTPSHELPPSPTFSRRLPVSTTRLKKPPCTTIP